MDIIEATPADLGELFSLQRAAFVDEAVLYGTPHVPALDETFETFVSRHAASTTFIARDEARITGAICLRTYEEFPDIERLMTAPDQRGRGIATALVHHAETHAFGQGHAAVQLIVGEIAHENRRLYEHLGYQTTRTWESEEFPGVVLLRMIKHQSPS